MILYSEKEIDKSMSVWPKKSFKQLYTPITLMKKGC